MAKSGIPFQKVVLLGEPAVGKTSIRRNFMGKSFKTKYISTIGTELSFYASDRMNLSIWDLAGEQNYATVRQSFYTGSRGVIAVFDITRPFTLDKLTNWFKEFEKLLRKDVVIVIAGNKDDLREEKENQIIRSEAYCEFLELHSQERNLYDQPIFTSAKTGQNVDTLFDVLITKMLEL